MRLNLALFVLGNLTNLLLFIWFKLEPVDLLPFLVSLVAGLNLGLILLSLCTRPANRLPGIIALTAITALCWAGAFIPIVDRFHALGQLNEQLIAFMLISFIIQLLPCTLLLSTHLIHQLLSIFTNNKR